MQEADLPGSGYTSGIAGCGLGVLLDAAIPQTKALAGELRRKYFHRLPDIPVRKLGISTLLNSFDISFGNLFIHFCKLDSLTFWGQWGMEFHRELPGKVVVRICGATCDWLSRDPKWMTCEYDFGR